MNEEKDIKTAIRDVIMWYADENIDKNMLEIDNKDGFVVNYIVDDIIDVLEKLNKIKEA